MKLRRCFLQSVMVTATIIAVVYLSIADKNNCCKKITVYSDRYNNNKLKSLEFCYLMDFSLYPTAKSTYVWHSNLALGSLGLRPSSPIFMASFMLNVCCFNWMSERSCQIVVIFYTVIQTYLKEPVTRTCQCIQSVIHLYRMITNNIPSAY